MYCRPLLGMMELNNKALLLSQCLLMLEMSSMLTHCLLIVMLHLIFAFHFTSFPLLHFLLCSVNWVSVLRNRCSSHSGILFPQKNNTKYTLLKVFHRTERPVALTTHVYTDAHNKKRKACKWVIV